MSDREEERGGDVEDLFGDLGRYFAPIEEDWPEGQAGGEADRPGKAAAGGAGPGGEEPEEPGEVTAEMSGEEWDRLRRAVAEDDGAPDGGRRGEEEAEEPEPEEPEEPGEPEEGPPITLEDLEDVPPAAEVGAEGEPAPEPPGEEEAVLAGDAAVVDEPEGEGIRPEEAEPEEPEEPEEAAEPDVEQRVTSEDAAEHFATGLSPDEVERELLSDLEGGAPAPPEVVEGAPTWREPAHEVEVAEEEEGGPPAPPPGRNVPAAAASALILAGAAIALLALGKGFFAVLAGAVVLVGQGEFYAVLERRGYRPATALGLVAGALIMAGAYVKGRDGLGEPAMLVGLVLGAGLAFLWYMAAPPGARKGAAINVGLTVLGIVWVPFLVSFALLLLAVPGDTGRNFVVVVVGLTVLYDLSAYAVGSLWGSRPLAPNVSPRKSWEGAIGATFVLLLVALALVPSIEPFNASKAAGLALVIAAAAPLGDLAESALKRDLGVKDMGSLLPGHGGVLDRIDAILFAAPAAYYYLRLVF